MKLDEALNIDIIDTNPPPSEPTIDNEEIKEDEKEKLLSDVPLDESEEEEQIVEFIPKPKPTKEDIFEGDVEMSVEEVEEPKVVPKVKKVKETLPKPKKKRKPMSEEHRAKLALAREKAIAKRQFLAEERRLQREKEKLVKDQEQILQQRQTQKELERLQKKLKKTKIKEPVSSDEEEEVKVPVKKNAQPMPSNFTMEDLQNAQLNAIMGYEAVRKKRKEEKKKKDQVNKQKKDIMDTIQKAKPSWYMEDSPFNGLF